MDRVSCDAFEKSIEMSMFFTIIFWMIKLLALTKAYDDLSHGIK
jgi:hypothetical protein